MRTPALALALLLAAGPLHAQSSAALRGQVFDASGAVILAAIVTVRSDATGLTLSVRTDGAGRYHFAAMPVGSYVVTASAPGFKSVVIERLSFEVGRTFVQDFQLAVGETGETVIVLGTIPLVDRTTTTVGHVVTAETVQEIPLNGRHFTDLALLVPGSVAPSQAGFSSSPSAEATAKSEWRWWTPA